MTKNNIIKLLKSGYFTIVYNDNDGGLIVEGKYDYEDLPEDYDSIDPDMYEFG